MIEAGTTSGRQRPPRRAGATAVVCRVAGMLAGVLAACLAAVVALAGPASAHANLVRTEPADQAKLQRAPSTLTMVFSEAVSPNAGGLSVIDQKGNAVSDEVKQPSPHELTTTLEPGLGDGTYVATYRIISEDGHPISGSIVFGVGDAALADVSTLTVQSDAGWEAASKVGQFLVYLGALGAAGIVFFLGFVHDGGAERRRLGAVVSAGFGTALAGMAVVLVAQAAQATGEGAGAIFDTSKLGTYLGNGLGPQYAGLLVGLVLCVVSSRAARGPQGTVLAGAATLLTTVPFALWGHASEGSSRLLAMPADAVHLVVAAVWFGGLIGVFAVLSGRGSGPVPASVGAAAVEVAPVRELSSTTDVVRRFSGVAFASLVALTAAGVVEALALSSIGDILSSTWGRLLLVKLLVVAAVAAAAGYNRYKLLPWLLGDTGGEQPADTVRAGWATLRSTVRFEALAIVGVLALTAVLVNTTPRPTAEVTPSGPFNQTQTFDGGRATFGVSPNRPGVNSMHVDLVGTDGKPLDVQAVQAEMTLESKGVGPIFRDMVHGGPGHYMLGETSDLSLAGDWQIDLVIRIDDFDEERLTFTDTVG